MRYSVLTCDGYRVESVWPTLHEAVAECGERERATGDGFARLVSLDGQLIADAEGSYSDPERCMDAATQTGMYDAW